MNPPPAHAPEVDAGAMIEAVLSGHPTEGGPRLLARHVPGRRGGSADSDAAAGADGPARASAAAGPGAKISAAAATVAGKIVLCAAVAAASVGGVYATDAVDHPWDSEPALTTSSTPSASTTSTSTSTSTTTTTTTTTAVDTAAVAAPEAAPAIEAGDGTAAPVDATDPEGLTGCEHGQATAAAASQNGSADRENSERDHDPCSASETAPGRSDSAADDAPTSQSGNGQGRGGNPPLESDGGPGRTNPPGGGGKG